MLHSITADQKRRDQDGEDSSGRHAGLQQSKIIDPQEEKSLQDTVQAAVRQIRDLLCLPCIDLAMIPLNHRGQTPSLLHVRLFSYNCPSQASTADGTGPAAQRWHPQYKGRVSRRQNIVRPAAA